jgi:hypothetical protein
MSDQPRPDTGQDAGAPEPPAFDKQAARQRYRATMRGPYMRSMYVLLALIILAAWGFGIGAVFARDVERLPNHDLSVTPSRCVACHTQPASSAPVMPHIAFPSCGFCHRQGPAAAN